MKPTIEGNNDEYSDECNRLKLILENCQYLKEVKFDKSIEDGKKSYTNN